MENTRSSDPREDEVRVLLAGPDSWLAAVEPAFAAAEAFSTRTVESAERATAVATEGSLDRIDCVVAAASFDSGTDHDATGLELLADLRSRDVGTPFVLAPSSGDESLASRAIEAGVDDYVLADADPSDLRRRCREVVERDRDHRHKDEAVAGFESLFSTPYQFVAVLDPDGTVVRANRAAVRALGVEERAVLGKRFWGLSWSDAADRRELQGVVQRALRGEYVDFEARLPGGIGDENIAEEGDVLFEFTVRPVSLGDSEGEGSSADADVDRLLVDGREVAERARLEAELRESEELHRVTLNNMTDTVLVTDDDGEFTYVCPNVHFIFGYSAEEIHELGSIDALLGEELFDRGRLDTEGVLTNVECTATDKDGREHALLVNVRQVSIQDGTVLYSCRDITKRKQRERALTQLHRTSRGLLYAETGPEIADRVVTDAASILPPAAAAVYQFDSEENALYPTAASDELIETLGTLPELRPDRGTVVSRAFVEGETRTADADTEANGGTPPGREQSMFAPLGDYVAVPLGDHGVFLAATTNGDSFDEIGEDVVELVAATTEAAFDRVERERELRDRDQRLQQQNEQLSQLNRVNEFIREIDQALVGAQSRENIEAAVCDRLTADDRFAFAWIGETTSLNRTLRPRAWAGDERGYLDSVPLESDAEAATGDASPVTGDARLATSGASPTSGDAGLASSIEPSLRAADERETVLVPNVADQLRTGQWCKEAVSRDFQSVLSIPLAYDDVLFGTLSIYAETPDAFDEMAQSVLRELGDTVASAINAVQRKEALRSDTVVELEYDVPDPNATLSRLASEADASLSVEGTVSRDDGTTLVFVATEEADPERVLDAAEEFVGVTDAKIVRETDDGGLVGLGVGGDFVTTVLADHGAVLRNLRATPGGLSLSVDVPDSVTTRSIDEVISNTYDAAEAVAQRERTRALDTTGSPGRLFDDLTERQLEVAQTAYHAGFFDAERDVTGRDVASMLDISHTAFYDHVRRIQRKLYASLFESAPRPSEVE
ncbi:bacterio-opsin activator domain-containing protein [Halorussus litoreus]|uniref:bacterio-opsin activator domain-containing protein n=1 Tax=Halorussus litoreus TaxID=1710536 RepID=UPI000E2707BD|nr:bacterio-opsin activator domain-containing protein [Halorussus litoreus]